VKDATDKVSRVIAKQSEDVKRRDKESAHRRHLHGYERTEYLPVSFPQFYCQPCLPDHNDLYSNAIKQQPPPSVFVDSQHHNRDIWEGTIASASNRKMENLMISRMAEHDMAEKLKQESALRGRRSSAEIGMDSKANRARLRALASATASRGFHGSMELSSDGIKAALPDYDASPEPAVSVLPSMLPEKEPEPCSVPPLRPIPGAAVSASLKHVQTSKDTEKHEKDFEVSSPCEFLDRQGLALNISGKVDMASGNGRAILRVASPETRTKDEINQTRLVRTRDASVSADYPVSPASRVSNVAVRTIPARHHRYYLDEVSSQSSSQSSYETSSEYSDRYGYDSKGK
jgi:hypothetical protein